MLQEPEMPFPPSRLYWIKNVPEGQSRGFHAHKNLRQFIFMIQGNVSIRIHDGIAETVHHLAEGDELLILEPGYWRVLELFSASAIVMVGCDAPYSENDYIRDWDDFLTWRKESSQ